MEKKGPCDNHNEDFERQPYYHGVQLLGVRCIKCGQEWLEERFLFHPDEDNTRHSVNVDGVVLKKQLEMEIESNSAFLVSCSRTMSMSNKFKFEGDDLKVGDHIAWHRPGGWWHHAIVSEVFDDTVDTGKVKVIQWEKILKAGKKMMKRTESVIYLKKQKGQLFRIDYTDEVTKINTSDLVIARGRSMLDDPGEYSIFGDNCEVLASYCKTGFAQSCQLVWLKRVLKIGASVVLTTIGRCFCDAALFVHNVPSGPLPIVLFSEGMANVSVEVCQIASQGIVGLGVGVVLLIEGACCIFDLSKIYDKRANGEISRVDFVQSSIRRAFAALASAGLCIGGSIAGSAAGTLICPGPGTAVGFLIGGILGGVAGGVLGKFVVAPVVVPWIARKCASCIGRDDRAVEIGDLQPGDHVVFYGNRLHPRHHAIVVDCDPVEGKVRVVHHTYKNGVVEEVLDFISPMYRLLYDNDCAAPDEVIERARSKIGGETCKYSLAFNNCKTFARWCKEKKTIDSRLCQDVRPLFCSQQDSLSDVSSDDDVCVLQREIRKFVVAPVVGPWVGRKFASIIGKDDRAVEIGDLQQTDHVVFYGNRLHPRHHAIVVDCDPVEGKVRVVHNTYKYGVVEEVLDFIPPVYRLLYDNDCAAPDEVIERARSKIGDETYKYSLALNNCKTFARCCKEKKNIDSRRCHDVRPLFCSQQDSLTDEESRSSDVSPLIAHNDSSDDDQCCCAGFLVRQRRKQVSP